MKWDDLKVRTSAKIKRGEVWLHPEDHRKLFTANDLVAELAHAKRLPDSVKYPHLQNDKGKESDDAARKRNLAMMDELRRKAAGGGA